MSLNVFTSIVCQLYACNRIYMAYIKRNSLVQVYKLSSVGIILKMHYRIDIYVVEMEYEDTVLDDSVLDEDINLDAHDYEDTSHQNPDSNPLSPLGATLAYIPIQYQLLNVTGIYHYHADNESEDDEHRTHIGITGG